MRTLRVLLVIGLVGAFGWQVAGQVAADRGDDEVEVPTITAEQAANLSPAEQVDRAEQILASAERVVERIQNMVEDAQGAHDIVRMACLEEKAIEVNTNIESAREHMTSLRGAVEAGDDDAGDHEFTILAVLSDKFDVANRAASQCLGQDAWETGVEAVTVDVDPNTPDEDPTSWPLLPDEPAVLIPPPASPTI